MIYNHRAIVHHVFASDVKLRFYFENTALIRGIISNENMLKIRYMINQLINKSTYMPQIQTKMR